MLNFLSIDANCIDALKAVAFAAVFLWHKQPQAGVVLISHALCEFILSSSLSGYATALSMTALYALVAGSNITIKSEIRYVFMILSCVNWLCAFDIAFYLEVDTYFAMSYTYLINSLDLLIIYHLFRPTHGGGKRANNYNSRFILGAGLGHSLLR